MAQYLVHQETKREFKVVALDKEAGTIILEGPNSQFTEPFDKERFKENGYTLVNKDEPKGKPKPAPAPEPEEDEPEDDDSADDDHDD